MIGLDTNILLRLFLDDDPMQRRKVDALIAQLATNGPAYVNCITLMEFAWYLRRGAGLSRTDVMAGISDLLDTEDIMIEDEHLVEAALDVMATASAEFSDVFISLRNLAAACTHTKTFDAKAAKAIPGMDLLA